MFHFPRVNLISFVTNLVVEIKLLNGQNTDFIYYFFYFTIIDPLTYVISFLKI